MVVKKIFLLSSVDQYLFLTNGDDLSGTYYQNMIKNGHQRRTLRPLQENLMDFEVVDVL